jgi:hypothetical protein
MAESIKAATRLDHFVFDGLDDGARLLLIDINPYSAACDTKLFTWSQLEPAQSVQLAELVAPLQETLSFSTDAEVEAFMQEQAKAAAAARGEEVDEVAPEVQATQGDQLTVKLLKAFQSKLATAPLAEADDDDMGEFADESSDETTTPVPEVVVPLFAVVSAEDAMLQAATMAVHAFPRDVVEVASTQDVSTMVKLMQQAQADESDEDSS